MRQNIHVNLVGLTLGVYIVLGSSFSMPTARSQSILNSEIIWAQSNYFLRAKAPGNVDLPTNAVVQLIGSSITTNLPPLEFGDVTGLTSNWFILDSAKVPRAGFVIGHGYAGSTNLFCTVRVLLPAGTYTGDGYTIPNPSVSGGVWMAQTSPKAWNKEFLFNIHSGLWSYVTLDLDRIPMPTDFPIIGSGVILITQPSRFLKLMLMWTESAINRSSTTGPIHQIHIYFISIQCRMVQPGRISTWRGWPLAIFHTASSDQPASIITRGNMTSYSATSFFP